MDEGYGLSRDAIDRVFGGEILNSLSLSIVALMPMSRLLTFVNLAST